ncbi:hypothetical protein [Nocardia altamirensis]|uniref:hypothetical protein n=1 Tax=Nocardia altamirensis TaxID=472158 RepID=UPI00083FFBB2|nr:hypothetical protein [Nocardia altamirensis]
MAAHLRGLGGRPPRQDGPKFRTVGANIPGTLARALGTPANKTARYIALLDEGLADAQRFPDLRVLRVTRGDQKGFQVIDPVAPEVNYLYSGPAKYISAGLAISQAERVLEPCFRDGRPVPGMPITIRLIELFHRGLRSFGELDPAVFPKDIDLDLELGLGLEATGTI